MLQENATGFAKKQILRSKAGIVWPRGVVVSALTSHVRGAGFDSWPG